METSNSPDLAPNATTETASPVENSAQNNSPDTAPAEQTAKPASLKDAILARKGAAPAPETEPKADDKPVVSDKPASAAPAPGAAPEAPKYEPNFKFKAFGKEKEIPELFRSLVKDADSEKQVREVFTRAEAFDDMKSRFEATTSEHQKVLNDFTALDRDVRRVTNFLNKGDLDNFFASVRLSDAQLIQYLQNKAQYMQDPNLKAQYQQQVQLRADNIHRQEQFEQMQNQYQTQAVQARAMQLDMLLARPDVSSVASAWDSKVGQIGAFRDLVIQEAAMQTQMTKQDITAEQAVHLALQRFGKLVQAQAPQAPMSAPAAQPAAQPAPAPQATAPANPADKPVIPTTQGKGTSPIKQSPKSLDDLKRMRKELERAENMSINV